MRFRSPRTPDSNSTHPTTSETHIIAKLDFHWFSVVQWDFGVRGPRIRTPRIELPLLASKHLAARVLAGNVLLTLDRRTNFKHFLDAVKPLLSVKGTSRQNDMHASTLV